MANVPVQAMASLVEEGVVDLRGIKNNTTLDAMNSAGRVKVTDDRQLKWDIVRENQGVQWLDIHTARSTTDAQDTVKWAELAFGDYRLSYRFPIRRRDIQDARKKSPRALADIFSDALSTGFRRITREMNRVIWNGTGVAADGGVIGILRAANNAQPYAGISSTDEPLWVAPTLTNTPAAALNRSILRRMDLKQKNEKLNYDSIWTSPTTAYTYVSVFEALATPAATVVKSNKADGSMNADLSLGDAYYKGRPLIEDSDIPDGAIYFLDWADITLFSFDMATDPTVTRGIANSSSEDYTQITASAKVNGLQVNFAQLPSMVPTILEFEMFVVPQLRVKNRRAIQAITGLTVDNVNI